MLSSTQIDDDKEEVQKDTQDGLSDNLIWDGVSTGVDFGEKALDDLVLTPLEKELGDSIGKSMDIVRGVAKVPSLVMGFTANRDEAIRNKDSHPHQTALVKTGIEAMLPLDPVTRTLMKGGNEFGKAVEEQAEASGKIAERYNSSSSIPQRILYHSKKQEEMDALALGKLMQLPEQIYNLGVEKATDGVNYVIDSVRDGQNFVAEQGVKNDPVFEDILKQKNNPGYEQIQHENNESNYSEQVLIPSPETLETLDDVTLEHSHYRNVIFSPPAPNSGKSSKKVDYSLTFGAGGLGVAAKLAIPGSVAMGLIVAPVIGYATYEVGRAAKKWLKKRRNKNYDKRLDKAKNLVDVPDMELDILPNDLQEVANGCLEVYRHNQAEIILRKESNRRKKKRVNKSWNFLRKNTDKKGIKDNDRDINLYQERSDEALNHVESLIKQHKQKRSYDLCKEAEELLRKKDFVAADKAYSQALQYDSGNKIAVYNKGICSLYQNDPEKALQQFDACKNTSIIDQQKVRNMITQCNKRLDARKESPITNRLQKTSRTSLNRTFPPNNLSSVLQQRKVFPNSFLRNIKFVRPKEFKPDRSKGVNSLYLKPEEFRRKSISHVPMPGLGNKFNLPTTSHRIKPNLVPPPNRGDDSVVSYPKLPVRSNLLAGSKRKRSVWSNSMIDGRISNLPVKKQKCTNIAMPSITKEGNVKLMPSLTSNRNLKFSRNPSGITSERNFTVKRKSQPQRFIYLRK